MVREVFRIHGVPVEIVSDRRPQLISHFWKEFCNRLGISVSLSSGLHPQTDGQSERANQEVETKLCLLCEGDPNKWAINLPWLEHAINSLPSSASGVSPFYTIYGFQPLLFSIQAKETQVPSAHRVALSCQCIWRTARRTLTNTSAVYIRGANHQRSQNRLTRWTRRFGCPQRTSLSKPNHVN